MPDKEVTNVRIEAVELKLSSKNGGNEKCGKS